MFHPPCSQPTTFPWSANGAQRMLRCVHIVGAHGLPVKGRFHVRRQELGGGRLHVVVGAFGACYTCANIQLPHSSQRQNTMNTATRFQDQAQYLWSFTDVIWVHCPKCGKRAEVRRHGSWRDYGLNCFFCGFARNESIDGITFSPRTAADPIVGLPLCLQIPCCGKILWAYNECHLRFLKEYVGALLREREPNKNSSLASRLPSWMKQAKHRDEVLRGIARLERLLLEN